jgi:hypothetical protein
VDLGVLILEAWGGCCVLLFLIEGVENMGERRF